MNHYPLPELRIPVKSTHKVNDTATRPISVRKQDLRSSFYSFLQQKVRPEKINIMCQPNSGGDSTKLPTSLGAAENRRELTGAGCAPCGNCRGSAANRSNQARQRPGKEQWGREASRLCTGSCFCSPGSHAVLKAASV